MKELVKLQITALVERLEAEFGFFLFFPLLKQRVCSGATMDKNFKEREAGFVPAVQPSSHPVIAAFSHFQAGRVYSHVAPTHRLQIPLIILCLSLTLFLKPQYTTPFSGAPAVVMVLEVARAETSFSFTGLVPLRLFFFLFFSRLNHQQEQKQPHYFLFSSVLTWRVRGSVLHLSLMIGSTSLLHSFSLSL